jgi:Beta-ketoacyl synthase, N-terminal domain
VTRAPAVRALGLLTEQARRWIPPPAGPRAGAARTSPPLSLANHDRRRRASRECLLALAAVEAMLEDAGEGAAAIAGERTGLLYATAAAYAASNRQFIEGGGTIHFAYTAPAVVPAEVAIEYGITGPYAVFLGGPPATLRAIWQAALWLADGICDRALVLVVETFAECADLYWRARRLTGWPLVEAAGCLWLAQGQGELVAEFRRAAGVRHRETRAGAAQSFGCEPLAKIEHWRGQAQRAPLELTGIWRGERARLAWVDAPAPDGAATSGRCGG